MRKTHVGQGLHAAQPSAETGRFSLDGVRATSRELLKCQRPNCQHVAHECVMVETAVHSTAHCVQCGAYIKHLRKDSYRVHEAREDFARLPDNSPNPPDHRARPPIKRFPSHHDTNREALLILAAVSYLGAISEVGVVLTPEDVEEAVSVGNQVVSRILG